MEPMIEANAVSPLLNNVNLWKDLSATKKRAQRLSVEKQDSFISVLGIGNILPKEYIIYTIIFSHLIIA